MSTIWFGGDYNPDQWPEHIMDEDLDLFTQAGVNILTLPVFSWSKFQPSEDVYSFDWFDTILEKITSRNISVCLATSTAVQPAWMSKKYPDMLPVDFEGRRRKFGGRVKFCPTSPDYLRLAGILTRKLAQRYGSLPQVKVWHVGNEYDNWCYCDRCESGFRTWLKKKYGSLEELNRIWYTPFWGHGFSEWDEIVAPSMLSEMWLDRGRMRSSFQAISLDYARYMSESILNCYRNERDILKEETPHIPVTTNFMGFFKPLDYFRWAPHLDVISWDSYPGAEEEPCLTSMRHDLMRSLKNGQSFLLMEQTPSQQNWQPYNKAKAPGLLRLQSWQALARGSDSVMFFQMRRSAGGCEKFHSGVIDHVGHGNTRVFRECADLGNELANTTLDFVSGTVPAQVGILFDWENWWSLEYSSGPSIGLDYFEQVSRWYRDLFERNIPVQFVHPSAKLDSYSLLFAPCLYMLSRENAQSLRDFVFAGGRLVTGFMSSIIDENDRVHLGGYPGPLREVLGIWVEEIDALPPDRKNPVKLVKQAEDDPSNRDTWFTGSLICDIMHSEGARVLGVYGEDFYAGTPALTVNNFGKGRAWYCGTNLDPGGTKVITGWALEGLSPTPWSEWTVPPGVEISRRRNRDSDYIFLLNHNDHPVTLGLGEGETLELDALGVRSLETAVRNPGFS